MARDRRGTTEDSTAVPGQRAEPALSPDAGRDDTEPTGGEGTAPAGAPTTPAGAPTQTAGPTGAGGPAQTGGPAGQTPPTSPLPQTDTAPGRPADHKIKHTRISGTWAAVVGFAVVLLLLLIFILQNQKSVEISYLGATGHLPLGVALLLAAVAGILLVALAGSARIMQLRTTARKHRRADAKAAKAAAKAQR
jgi:uncharacterized integral membrane protein